MTSPAPRPRISVLGTGYLGATHAVCMTELGYEVIGLDVDASKVAKLASGEVPFFEPGLTELLRKSLDTGRLSFTTSYEEAAHFADVHFVCVGTPQTKGGYAADLTYVDAAFSSLAPMLTRPALVVGKSTVPAGTAARMAELVASLAPCPEVEVAWNPEFLREGFAVEDTLRPDRLVFGVRSTGAEARLRETYGPVIENGCPVVVTDFATAELVKVAANSFLATKISFINAMAEICEVTGADVTKLSQALGYDDRIGRRFLQAGLGFGGGCLPKDIRAFMARADELGVAHALAFLQNVDEINLRRRSRVVDLGRELMGGSLRGARVAVWGAAFKPNSDDIRDSPALNVAAAVRDAGAQVVVYDPAAVENARRAYPQLSYADSALSAARDADLVLLLTEWTEFRQMDPAVLADVVAGRRIVDARNVLDPAQWRAAGWNHRSLGRP